MKKVQIGRSRMVEEMAKPTWMPEASKDKKKGAKGESGCSTACGHAG